MKLHITPRISSLKKHFVTRQNVHHFNFTKTGAPYWNSDKNMYLMQLSLSCLSSNQAVYVNVSSCILILHICMRLFNKGKNQFLYHRHLPAANMKDVSDHYLTLSFPCSVFDLTRIKKRSVKSELYPTQTSDVKDSISKN